MRGWGAAWIVALAGACGGVTAGGTVDGGLADAGSDAEVDERAGVIACGAATCDRARSELCCATYAPGSVPSCTASCVRGDSFMCDGPEDCAGSPCCAAIENSGTHAVCRPACTAGRDLLLCHADADCAGSPGGASRCCPVNPTLFPGIGACAGRCP